MIIIRQLKKSMSRGAVAVGVIFAMASFLDAQEALLEEIFPEGAKVTKIDTYPDAIRIERKFDYRQILVTGHLEPRPGYEGLIDLTRLAQLRVGDSRVAVVAPGGKVEAVGNGSTDLLISFRGIEVKIPIEVSHQTDRYVASYVQDVQPILSGLGCNAGTCHGSAKGKNGFKLSLRGFDYAFDHLALTDDHAGRRFNRAAPDRSLFLLKTSGVVPHQGGVITEPGKPYYEVLRSWVADGVKLDLDSPRVDKLEILPRQPVMPLPGMKQQMVVIATYTDGKMRDVTAEAVVAGNNNDVVTVNAGLVSAIRRGEAAVMARYEGRYAAVPLVVMGDRSGFEWQDVPEYNEIDQFVHSKLKKIKALSGILATDSEYLRRIYIDLTGRPPTAKVVRTFLLDHRETKIKRDELVDRLIGGTEYVEHWTNKWADLLQVNPKWLGKEGARALREWVRGAVASNTPYDEFVHAVITGSGSTLKNPPSAYYKVLRDPEVAVENTTQLFLGIRFNCNKCHDHPFEKWTQRNYWELSAYFARVDRKNAPGSAIMPRRAATQTSIPAFEEIISEGSKGEVSFPTGGTAQPSFPFDVPVSKKIDPNQRRQQLAAWLTSSRNPYFARSFVNRLWSYFMGPGIIDPVDDVRAGNPPSNPELLDYLEREFIASGFDTRSIVRLICRSRTYRLSIETNRWNEDDNINYSHAIARRLQAETLFDAIHMATGSTAKLPGLRSGARASEAGPSVKLGDGFLDLFGRPPRESACECERGSGMSLGQALNLVNGPTVANAVRDPNNLIAELVSFERNDALVIDEIFLSTLSRFSTSTEKQEIVKLFDVNDPLNADALEPEARKILDDRLKKYIEKQNLALWQPLDIQLMRSAGGATLVKQKDGSILLVGKNPDVDTLTLVAYTELEGITGFQLELLPDKSLKAKGPGRADNGNLVLSEFKVTAASASDPTVTRAVQLQSATQNFQQKGYPGAAAIDGKNDDKNGWAIGNEFGKPHKLVVEAKEDIGFKGGTLLTFRLEQFHGTKHTIGKFRINVATSRRPVRHTALGKDLIAALLIPADKRTTTQKAKIFSSYIRSDAEMKSKIRLSAAQDLMWALINSPAFLFNR